MLRAGAVVAAALAVAACSATSARPVTSAVGTPTATPAASAVAAAAARASLASYAASYSFRDADRGTAATVHVWRRDDDSRVDVVTATTTATLVVTSRGSWSCSVRGVTRSCLTVAGAGQPVPHPFDVTPITLFTTTMQDLAGHAASYDVTPADAVTGAPGGARCFAVRPQSVSEPVPEGTYCFTTDGLLAAATYPSGNTIRLLDSVLQPPPEQTFVPYAAPRPLPS